MRLIDHFIPLFAYVRQFQEQPAGDASGLAERLDAMVAAARSRAGAAGVAAADIEAALFAVCAWIDETLLGSGWSEAQAWQRLLLQRRYFNVSNAGIGFFERLDRLGEPQLEVREIYYFCLGLGFAGRYGYDRNAQALNDIKQANLALLLKDAGGLTGVDGALMFPDGYGTPSSFADGKRRGRRLSWGLLSMLLAPPLLVLALYGLYHSILWRQVSTILPQLAL